MHHLLGGHDIEFQRVQGAGRGSGTLAVGAGDPLPGPQQLADGGHRQRIWPEGTQGPALPDGFSREIVSVVAGEGNGTGLPKRAWLGCTLRVAWLVQPLASAAAARPDSSSRRFTGLDLPGMSGSMSRRSRTTSAPTRMAGA